MKTLEHKNGKCIAKTQNTCSRVLVFSCSRNQGFTLIELMVAISIIGILSVIGILNYQGTLKKARDSRRQSDLEQLRGALELYRADQGAYPENLYPTATTSCTMPIPLTAPPPSANVYMNNIPCDPLTKTPYRYARSGTVYKIGAVMEMDSVATQVACSATSTTPALAGGVTYCVMNP